MRAGLAALLLAVPLLAAASPGRLELDLGQGLAYVRVRALPGDLPSPPARPGPIVLDLRYATASPDAPAALGAWLQFRASPHTPVLVLVNPGTADVLLDFLGHAPPSAGVVTLGPTGPRLAPDVPLQVAPDTERAAYDALDQGATVTSLLSDLPDKPRHDEAELAAERKAAPAGNDAEDEASSDATPAAAPAAIPPPLIDTTLQRAVQLHRALLALRKI